MSFIKKILSKQVSAMMLFSATILTVTASDSLTVNFRDGTTARFEFARRPTVSYSHGLIRIVLPDFETEYDAASVRTFTFGNQTGIVEVAPERSEFRMIYTCRDCAIIEGLDNGGLVTVYAVNGNIALTSTADSDGVVALDFSGLQPGVYIIVAYNGQTFKISR